MPALSLFTPILALLVAAMPVAAAVRVSPGAARVAAAEGLVDRGQFEDAVGEWRSAAREFGKTKDAGAEAGALLGQAAALRALGHHKLALEVLADAGEAADRAKSRRRQAEVKLARGVADIFSRQANQSEDLLRDALKVARAEKADALAATALDALAIILVAQDKYPEAITSWDEAAALATRAKEPALAVRARKNKADAAFGAKQYGDAQRWAGEAAETAKALPDGHEKAFLMMGVAQIFQRLFTEAPEHENALRLRAFKLHAAAAKIAEAIGDRRALSYALGYQGGLYEFEKKHDAALALSRRALALAQQAQIPDAVYRWQWQTARLLAKEKQRDPAIDGYRRAVETLGVLRNDVAIRQGNVNAHSSFRESVGGLYSELADLLLQRADVVKDPKEVQALLREARGTAELLKAAELEDYFQDDCVSLLKAAKTKTIESLSRSAAVIYVIPLPDRTEILVSLPPPPLPANAKPGAERPVGEVARFKAEVSDEQLTATVRQFRLHLEARTTNEFLTEAQQLYAWLIKPLEGLMAAHHFDTMVFVPDGALRTIPMAALHDGEHFLIEKYAVAISPGLELTIETKTGPRVVPRLIISAITESVQNFPPLPNVQGEVDAIGKLFTQHDTLMNGQYLKASIEEKIAAVPYSIVHIASHGHIDNDVRKSYVLTSDTKLTLDDLERMIRPLQLNDNALEMLTLSACQTAAGDDRAALGLAGMAVKAGARSAFATLWFVNDQASAHLVIDFYSGLKNQPERSKAQALQAAQVKLLKDERFAHPCFWAPYLIIGNWL